jgi:hypothetical protein
MNRTGSFSRGRTRLARAALVLVTLYACGVSVALSYKNADLERERERVVEVAQMLELTKFWLRGTKIDLQQLPPGYARLPIDDSTPHGRTDAEVLVLLTSPNAPPDSRMRSAPHFSDVVFDGLNALYVDAQGGFVDVEWSKW